MAKVVENNLAASWITMSTRAVLNVLVIGVVVGLVNYALYIFFNQLVFQPLLCSGNGGMMSCSSSAGLANGLSILIASTIGLVFLVRERVYRPLLVVLAAGVALGGLASAVVVLPWYAAALVVVVAYAVAYALFAWLSQPSNLIASITMVIVAASLARLMLAI